MQYCPNCGYEVRYIATGFNETAICDAKEIDIVTENGHKFRGYPRHYCQCCKKQENDNGNGRNGSNRTS